MAMGKLDLEKDLKFGTLNDIEDRNVRNSGDRRRTSSLQALNSSIRAEYDPNTLEDVDVFRGIVVHKRQIQTPRYQNRTSLLRSFVASAPDLAAEASASIENTTGNDRSPKEEPYTAYKVYVPEMDPRPAPSSFTDPILHTYPDLLTPPGREDLKDLPLGAVVEIMYEDSDRMFNPFIMGGTGETFVMIAGYEEEQQNLELMFGAGPVQLMDGTGAGQHLALSAGQVNEQTILGIPYIKKSNTNKESDSYTHWGDDPAMKTLLTALNKGGQEMNQVLTINSALRTPYNQVRIMFQNYKKKGGLQDRAAGRKYLVDLYNTKAANAIVDAWEKGNYTTEEAAGAGAGSLAAPSSPYFHISKHQLGKAVDVAFGGYPTPNEKVAKALLAAAQASKGINILIEKDHFHVSYEGANVQSKVRRFGGAGGPTNAQVASVAGFGLPVGKVAATA